MAASTAQRKPTSSTAGPYADMKEMTASVARNSLPSLAIQCGLGDPGIVLTQHDRKVAVLIGAREFERLKEIEQHNKSK